MRPAPATALLAAFGCVAAMLIWWRATSRPAGEKSTPGTQSRTDTRESPGLVSNVSREPEPRGALAGNAVGQGTGPAFPGEGHTAGSRTPGVAEDALLPARISWPAARARSTAKGSAVSGGEPAVPVRLAFRALWYLGVDPEAERTWSRAINDPSSPPGVRSDLLVDMIDEGYTDNSHPTKADLPLIRARLELIERLAPYAMDQVNADAFEEAYKDLLAMYVRLTRS